MTMLAAALLLKDLLVPLPSRARAPPREIEK